MPRAMNGKEKALVAVSGNWYALRLSRSSQVYLVKTPQNAKSTRPIKCARAPMALIGMPWDGNATPTGETRRGSRRARKVDRRLGSACVGSAAVGSEPWLVKVSGGHCGGQGQPLTD